MKKLFSVIGSLLLMASLFSLSVGAASPNYGFSEEYVELIYDGFVQCQPSYIENGHHAANGYLRFQNGQGGDTGRLYTETGSGPNDSAIYSKHHRYWDSLNPGAPQVTFNYGFTWVKSGSGIWP